jgi:hypothetical protein
MMAEKIKPDSRTAETMRFEAMVNTASAETLTVLMTLKELGYTDEAAKDIHRIGAERAYRFFAMKNAPVVEIAKEN